jgi:thymidylate kinase
VNEQQIAPRAWTGPDERDPSPHPLLGAVFRALDQAGMAWCLLRGKSGLGKPRGDIDLLVDWTDLRRLRKVLEPLGFVQLPESNQSSHRHFVSYHRPSRCWIWLHVVAELAFGPGYTLKTHAEAGCLARRQFEGSIAELAPDDALWAILLHCLLDKGAIAPRHRDRVRELVTTVRGDSPLAVVMERICAAEWTPARMVECVRRGDWSVLESAAPDLRGVCLRRRSWDAWHLRIPRASELIDRLRTAWRRRGLSVALLGPDGAGKSTLAGGIQDSFVFPTRSIYMGLTGGQLPRMDRLWIPGLVVLGRLCIFWARYLVAQYHKARGRLVIFDRYIYDAAVPHPDRLSRLRLAVRWVDGHACPGPDLVLVLSAAGHVMYARKEEYSPEVLESWRQSFLALHRRIPRLEVVDATLPEDTVCADAIDQIWRRYAARWSAYRQ